MSKLGIRFDERRVISLCWSHSNPLVGRRGIHSSTDSTRRSSCCSSASPAEGIRPLTSGELDSFFEELRQQQQQQHSSSGSWRPLSDPISTTSSFSSSLSSDLALSATTLVLSSSTTLLRAEETVSWKSESGEKSTRTAEVCTAFGSVVNCKDNNNNNNNKNKRKARRAVLLPSNNTENSHQRLLPSPSAWLSTNRRDQLFVNAADIEDSDLYFFLLETVWDTHLADRSNNHRGDGGRCVGTEGGDLLQRQQRQEKAAKKQRLREIFSESACGGPLFGIASATVGIGNVKEAFWMNHSLSAAGTEYDEGGSSSRVGVQNSASPSSSSCGSWPTWDPRRHPWLPFMDFSCSTYEVSPPSFPQLSQELSSSSSTSSYDHVSSYSTRPHAAVALLIGPPQNGFPKRLDWNHLPWTSVSSSSSSSWCMTAGGGETSSSFSQRSISSSSSLPFYHCLTTHSAFRRTSTFAQTIQRAYRSMWGVLLLHEQQQQRQTKNSLLQSGCGKDEGKKNDNALTQREEEDNHKGDSVVTVLFPRTIRVFPSLLMERSSHHRPHSLPPHRLNADSFSNDEYSGRSDNDDHHHDDNDEAEEEHFFADVEQWKAQEASPPVSRRRRRGGRKQRTGGDDGNHASATLMWFDGSQEDWCVGQNALESTFVEVPYEVAQAVVAEQSHKGRKELLTTPRPSRSSMTPVSPLSSPPPSSSDGGDDGVRRALSEWDAEMSQPHFPPQPQRCSVTMMMDGDDEDPDDDAADTNDSLGTSAAATTTAECSVPALEEDEQEEDAAALAHMMQLIHNHTLRYQASQWGDGGLSVVPLSNPEEEKEEREESSSFSSTSFHSMSRHLPRQGDDGHPRIVCTNPHLRTSSFGSKGRHNPCHQNQMLLAEGLGQHLAATKDWLALFHQTTIHHTHQRSRWCMPREERGRKSRQGDDKTMGAAGTSSRSPLVASTLLPSSSSSSSSIHVSALAAAAAAQERSWSPLFIAWDTVERRKLSLRRRHHRGEHASPPLDTDLPTLWWRTSSH